MERIKKIIAVIIIIAITADITATIIDKKDRD